MSRAGQPSKWVGLHSQPIHESNKLHAGECMSHRGLLACTPYCTLPCVLCMCAQWPKPAQEHKIKGLRALCITAHS